MVHPLPSGSSDALEPRGGGVRVRPSASVGVRRGPGPTMPDGLLFLEKAPVCGGCGG